eukprot:TRINITY_DN11_c0_g1_i1.p1 TRINITY_DN11_c0_g1~~TRINITY_DN11_c0_g1_i1.p1  ORF type:complete len:1252 (+),score=140.33 TRINITY_DN11_c0_g1_i1:201-3956(+)
MDKEKLEKLVNSLKEIKDKTLIAPEIKKLFKKISSDDFDTVKKVCGKLDNLQADEFCKQCFQKINQETLLNYLCTGGFKVAIDLGQLDTAHSIASEYGRVDTDIFIKLVEEREYDLMEALRSQNTPVFVQTLPIADSHSELPQQSDPQSSKPDSKVIRFALKHKIKINGVGNSVEDKLNTHLAKKEEKEAINFLTSKIDEVDDSSLLLAIYNDCLEYAIEFVKLKVPIEDKASSIFSLLFRRISKQMSREPLYLDVYLYLIRTYLDHMKIENSGEFAYNMELILNSKAVTENLSKLFNPIKFIVQLIELIVLFQSRFPNMTLNFDRIKERLIQLGTEILDEVKTEEQKRLLLVDKDFENRDTLALILKYSLIRFLNNSGAEEIANETWYGPYNFTKNPWYSTSSLWKLSSPTFHKEKDVEKEEVRDTLFKKDMKEMQTHQFEFSVWRDSARLNVLFLLFEYLAITIGILVMELLINEAISDMENHYEKEFKVYNDTKNSTREFNLSLNEFLCSQNTSNYYDAVLRNRDITFWWDFIALLALTSSLRFIIYPLFGYLTGRNKQIITYRGIVNFILFVTLVVIYLPYNGEASVSIFHSSAVNVELCNLTDDVMEDPYIGPLSAITEFCLCLCIAYMLKYTSFFGPIVTVLGSLIVSMIRFIIIYFAVLLVFSVATILLFPIKEVKDKGIYYVVFMLFQDGFKFDSNVPNEIVIKPFYVIFKFVTKIVLMNFVLAILYKTYTKVVNKQEAILFKDLLLLRDQYKSHKKYQFMVSSFSVFDVILCILFLPIFPFLSPSKGRLLNTALTYLEYTFCFIIVFPFYIAVEIVLLPICYLMVMAKKINIFIKNPSLCSFMEILWFLVLGPLFLLFYMIEDIYNFTVHAYTHQPPTKNKGKSAYYVAIETLRCIEKYFESSTAKDWKRISKQFKDRFDKYKKRKNVENILKKYFEDNIDEHCKQNQKALKDWEELKKQLNERFTNYAKENEVKIEREFKNYFEKYSEENWEKIGLGKCFKKPIDKHCEELKKNLNSLFGNYNEKGWEKFKGELEVWFEIHIANDFKEIKQKLKKCFENLIEENWEEIKREIQSMFFKDNVLSTKENLDDHIIKASQVINLYLSIQQINYSRSIEGKMYLRNFLRKFRLLNDLRIKLKQNLKTDVVSPGVTEGTNSQSIDSKKDKKVLMAVIRFYNKKAYDRGIRNYYAKDPLLASINKRKIKKYLEYLKTNRPNAEAPNRNANQSNAQPRSLIFNHYIII